MYISISIPLIIIPHSTLQQPTRIIFHIAKIGCLDTSCMDKNSEALDFRYKKWKKTTERCAIGEKVEPYNKYFYDFAHDLPHAHKRFHAIE